MNENNEYKSGKLILVGTPLGNLSDFSPRAVETLKNSDFIAAEDTRVTMKLLSRFEIKKTLVSCFEHNERSRAEYIIERILNGETCAYVTDAGMPCISDPGIVLVSECVERGVEITTTPSATAFATAAAISGINCTRFSFEGFLSMNKKQRVARLLEIKDYTGAILFYEAPHKLKNTLSDLFSTLGDRKIAICRELTKIHEEVIRSTLSKIIEYYENVNPKGEFVIVIEGKDRVESEKDEDISFEEAVKKAAQYMENGDGISEAAKKVAKETRFSKSEIYRILTQK